ncbi:unnamed protein product [Phytophthora fragariaefolia]|uniref:Unnamed protein product n=1 Tax=Phytophthora fragariaefolia TaxID=1490495 RepID=A0A9W6Y2J8_9STRA|nr:unnamed protein product [Phytophthora fragariaefolia]
MIPPESTATKRRTGTNVRVVPASEFPHLPIYQQGTPAHLPVVMGLSKACFSSTLAVAMLLATANGHGYLTAPAVTFLSSSTDNTQFIATIESSASGFSGTFSGSPADNTAAFTTAFDSSSYTSLKDLITSLATVTVTDATLTCGSCDPDETAQPLPDTYVEWSHSSTEGFTSSHEGPCEVWCDDVRVFQDDDCAADYTTAPAELPYDRDACLGASTLTFYWLALHSSTWQVYVNCAPLESTTSTGATSKYAVSGTSFGTTSTSTATSNSTSSTSTSTSAPSTTAATTTSSASSGTPSTSTSTTSTTSAPTTGTTSSSASTTTATAAPSSASTTSTSTTTTPSTSATSITTAPASSSGTSNASNQWGSPHSTGSTTKSGGSSATSVNDTTQGQWPSTSANGNSDVQATIGTVSPNQDTTSGWGHNVGWGNSFGFRH